jgi:Cu2+-exporting ATPase
VTDLIGGGCCAPTLEAPPKNDLDAVRSRLGPLDPYIEIAEDGVAEMRLMVDGITCGGCISKIERGLLERVGVARARVNLSTNRLIVGFNRDEIAAESVIATLDQLGYRAVPFDPAALKAGRDAEEKRLLRAMAIAGFAAANVMLLSVSVWAGHFQDMGPATRTLMHWISALIAVPTVVYAGRPFFDSALSALRAGRTNMDVPISLAVVLATGMSLLETMRGADHAYFDSAVSLLFFLLIGRYLDRRARGKARSAAEQLTGLSAIAATVIDDDGSVRACAPGALRAGMTVLVAVGDRVPVDGTVLSGRSELDTQIITGESLPEAVDVGAKVFAGAVNLGAPLKVTVKAAGEGTLLAEIARLMEAAEQRKTHYVGLADAVSRWYAPVVHTMALAAFIGWFGFMGMDWQPALLIAVAVLIITCPCALGLAVPVVQVLACSRLMRSGVLLKSGSGLERLADIDMVVFDKTGTLTQGKPRLIDDAARDPEDVRRAAALAAASLHPLAKALTAAAGPGIVAADGVVEHPGDGLEWRGADGVHRLGRRPFACPDRDDATVSGPEMWYARPGQSAIRFAFEDAPREDAKQVVDALKARGLQVRLLSGDREAVVSETAARLGIESWRAEVTPDRKVAELEALRDAGHKPAMVGDGLNDAPALAAAYVSLSPAGAAEISRTAADLVFQGDRLGPILTAYRVARASRVLVKQNFALAFLYNIFTVPIAVAGFVTPLIAALAMSASSIVVIGNALRLGWTIRDETGTVRPRGTAPPRRAETEVH